MSISCSQVVGSSFQTKNIAATSPGPAESSDQISPDRPVEIKICSQLDLKGIVWPKSLSFDGANAMALALNITGSFEGGDGWKNITGNFDGMGISLGLSQQNLGMGSLQPLLLQMLRKHESAAVKFFSPTQWSALGNMLNSWAVQRNWIAPSKPVFDELFSQEELLNSLDGKPTLLNPNSSKVTTSPEKESVDWAVSTVLDSKGSLMPAWSKSFVSIAVTPEYKTIQVDAALLMFEKAMHYFNYFKFRQLNSLLLMYDIVVQNGGFSTTHLNSYNSFLLANTKATEDEKTLKLVEIRAASVLPQYKNDVLSRKTAIVKSIGKVHGSQRNLEKEYCFSSHMLPEI